MEEFKEKFDVTYSCGCVHEIGRNVSGMWVPTGNDKDCVTHKVK